MKNKHLKHPPIKRSSIQSYHRLEWGIYGTDCSGILGLFKKIESSCSPDLALTYVDADHSNEAINTSLQIGKKQFRYSKTLSWNDYDDRLFNWPVDAVFVNGNHYPAERQIVVLDPKKQDSLFRRLDQLTHIDLILTMEKESSPYEFLKDKISKDTIVLSIHDLDKIVAYIKEVHQESIPPLKAIILAGGESKRMQLDKSNLIYHEGQTQLSYLANLCKSRGLETYISRSHAEVNDEIEGFPVIKDSLINMGPFGAIVSAFVHDPNSAYLVLACDLPLVDKKSIQSLIDSRNSSKHATAYKLKDQRFPEPLMAIYEPNVYQRMLRLFSLGYACPRKVLINSDVELLELENDELAFNANTPQEREEALKLLEKRK